MEGYAELSYACIHIPKTTWGSQLELRIEFPNLVVAPAFLRFLANFTSVDDTT